MPYLIVLLLFAGVETELERLKDPSANARLDACQALEKMGAEASAAVPALIRTLDDRNGLVRRGAILALGAIGDVRAVEPLAKRLASLDERNRGLAAASLLRIGKPAVPAVIQVLREGKPHARAAAARALPPGEATDDLTAALRDKALEVRVAAAGTLLKADPTDAAARTTVQQAITGRDVQIADQAIQAVDAAGVHDEATIAALAKALASSDQGLRWRSARALGRAGPKATPALPALDGAMRTSSYYVRTAVAYALGRIGSSAIPTLLGLLRVPDLEVAVEVAHAFKSLETEALFELLGSDKAYVVARTARACAALGKTAAPALPALRKALQHEDLTVRGEAGRAVWLIAGDAEAALPALMAALGAQGPEVRRNAATTLGGLGGRALDAVPLLEKLVKDPDKKVAQAAERALKRING